MSTNPNVKDAYQIQEFTEHQIQEILKCQNDPLYFIQNYVKITTRAGQELFKMHDYQKEIIENVHNHDNCIALASRQLGKCIFFNGLITIVKKPDELGALRRFILKLFFPMIYFRLNK